MLLDTFISIFESDTEGLRRGYEQAQRSTDEIVETMERADDQAKITSRSIASMLARAAAGFISLAAVNRGIQGAINRSSEIYALNQTAEAIGTNVTALDAFSKAIVDSGGTAQGATSTIENLYKSIGQAALNAESQQGKALAATGVALRNAQGEYRDTLDIALDLSDAMQSMGGPEAEGIAQQLGLSDRRTIEVMIQGRQELERTMRAHKEYGGITQEAAEQAIAFSDASSYLSQGLGALRDRVVTRLMPAITWLYERLGELVRWMHDNEAFVQGFFIALSGIIARRFLPVMISAAASVWAAAAPFIAVGAAIALAAAAFALIYDDIVNFMRGNDSLIGQIVEQYPALGRVIMWLVETAQALFQTLAGAVRWVGEQFGVHIGGIMDVIRLFVRILLETLNTVAEWGIAFVQPFQTAADKIIGIFEWLGAQVNKLMGPIKDSIEWVAGFLGLGDSGDDPDTFPDAPDSTTRDQGELALPPELGGAQQMLNQAANEPMNSVTRESITNQYRQGNRSSEVSVGEINVHTQATDAQGVAREVGTALEEQLRMVNAEFASGIDR